MTVSNGRTRSIIAAVVLAGFAVPALSQGYPARAIRLVVPNAPGSSGDIVARLIAPPLTERLGQPVVVDNRAGAGTMIGGDAVAKSRPDGYTLLLGFSTLAINPAMYKKVPYDAARDFAPISHLVSAAGVLVAHPSLPARTVKELITLAKARPDAIAYASTGQGTYSHVTTALFTSMAGVRMLHVPYKGTGPAVAAVVGGEMAFGSINILTALPHVRSGRLRALGVTSTKRAESAPDIPTIAEAGLPGYESVQWLGLLAPAGTPGEIIGRLYKESGAVIRAPETRQRLAADGAEAIASSPDEFGAYIRSETVKWAKVLKTAGVEPQ